MLNNNIQFISIFEQKMAEYTGFKHVVCTDCCTNGILISLEMLYRNNIINKTEILNITKYTYISVPMTLINNGWKINLVEDKWNNYYRLGETCVCDAATDMHENMVNDYHIDDIVCISFQQKKRLSLGRGGAILFNNDKYLSQLKRLVYDGRNTHFTDQYEILTEPDNILCGYHCYMEPDKAAQGILKLNQKQLLPKYNPLSWNNYISIDLLPIFKNNEK